MKNQYQYISIANFIYPSFKMYFHELQLYICPNQKLYLYELQIYIYHARSWQISTLQISAYLARSTNTSTALVSSQQISVNLNKSFSVILLSDCRDWASFTCFWFVFLNHKKQLHFCWLTAGASPYQAFSLRLCFAFFTLISTIWLPLIHRVLWTFNLCNQSYWLLFYMKQTRSSQNISPNHCIDVERVPNIHCPTFVFCKSICDWPHSGWQSSLWSQK